MNLDSDTVLLYEIIERRGQKWVKDRLCPKEAATFALAKHAKQQVDR